MESSYRRQTVEKREDRENKRPPSREKIVFPWWPTIETGLTVAPTLKLRLIWKYAEYHSCHTHMNANEEKNSI